MFGSTRTPHQLSQADLLPTHVPPMHPLPARLTHTEGSAQSLCSDH